MPCFSGLRKLNKEFDDAFKQDPNPNMAKAKGDDNITDIEEIVKQWASTMWELTKTREQKNIQKQFLQFNVNWKNVKFDFETPDYDIIPFVAKSGGQGANTQPQILFKTNFANNTAHDQEYCFKAERTTRSTATIIVEKGFTRGMEFGLNLKTPGEVLEANAGFKREMTVCNIGEDTIEEELTWGVDSSIKVPALTETTAELVISEAQCTGNFVLHTRFRGTVIVTVTNLKENNSLVTIFSGDIKDIMRDNIQKGLQGFTIDGRNVIAETKGSCKFKFGVEQRVKVHEAPISPKKNFYNH